ncbi:MAG: aminopeptidase P family protein, partial [Rhodospirillaceae bacterium]|nr:aminopeptidase P family protein [Rhodospirillaceae bacterium]
AIPYPQDFDKAGYDGVFEPGMVVCVESYTGRVGGREGIKLEEQVVITETGYDPISVPKPDPQLS